MLQLGGLEQGIKQRRHTGKKIRSYLADEADVVFELESGD